MPIPKAPPIRMPDDGTNYGYIEKVNVKNDITINKGKPDEEHGVIIVEVRVNTVLPDLSGDVDCKCQGTLFLHTDEEHASGNVGYEYFLESVGEGLISIEAPGLDEPLEMLPDPDENRWLGKLVKIRCKKKSRSYEGRTYEYSSIERWEQWDGTDPETGEQLDIRPPVQNKDPWEEDTATENDPF